MGYLHHKGIIHKVTQIMKNKISKSSSPGLEDKEHLLGERKSDHHRLRLGQCGEEVVLEVQEAWRYFPGEDNMIIISSFLIMSMIPHIFSFFFILFLIFFVPQSRMEDCMSIPAGWLCYLSPEVCIKYLNLYRNLVYRLKHLS